MVATMVTSKCTFFLVVAHNLTAYNDDEWFVCSLRLSTSPDCLSKCYVNLLLPKWSIILMPLNCQRKLATYIIHLVMNDLGIWSDNQVGTWFSCGSLGSRHWNILLMFFLMVLIVCTLYDEITKYKESKLQSQWQSMVNQPFKRFILVKKAS